MVLILFLLMATHYILIPIDSANKSAAQLGRFWKVGSNLYSAGWRSGYLQMFKSTDSGETWAEMHAAGRPSTLASPPLTIGITQDVHASSNTVTAAFSNTSNKVNLVDFDFDTDQWSSVYATASAPDEQQGHMGVVKRPSDGHVLYIYRRVGASSVDLYFKKWDGSAWGAETWLSTSTGGTYQVCTLDAAVLDPASSTITLHYVSRPTFAGTEEHHITAIKSDNSLVTPFTYTETPTRTSNLMLSGFVLNSKVYFQYISQVGATIKGAYIITDSASNPTTATFASQQDDSLQGSISSYTDGTTLWMFYLVGDVNNVGQKLRYKTSANYGSTWSAATDYAGLYPNYAETNHLSYAQPVGSNMGALFGYDSQSETNAFIHAYLFKKVDAAASFGNHFY